MDYKTRRTFEKAFIKAIPNFDETRCWFKRKSGGMSSGGYVMFVTNEGLKKIHMYYAEHYVKEWAGYFEVLFATGDFPNEVWWQPYGGGADNLPPYVAPFDLSGKMGTDYYYFSKNWNVGMNEARAQYPDCGVKRIPLPKERIEILKNQK